MATLDELVVRIRLEREPFLNDLRRVQEALERGGKRMSQALAPLKWPPGRALPRELLSVPSVGRAGGPQHAQLALEERTAIARLEIESELQDDIGAQRARALIEERDRQGRMVELWRGAGRSIEDVLIDALGRGERAFDGLRSVALSALRDIERAFLSATTGGESLGSVLGGFLGQAILGFAGDVPRAASSVDAIHRQIPIRRQHGGPVGARVPVLVGERAPELFVPDVGGRILSGVRTKEILAPQPEPLSVTVNVATGVAPTVRAEIRRLLPEITASVTAGVIDAKRRGGSARRLLRA
jgi:hypothetical protein